MANVTIATYDSRGIQVSTSQMPVPDELANVDTLVTKLQAAIDNNRTFLGIPAPTNAQLAAQLQSLTRQVNGLIRLRLGMTQDIAGA